jgi:hypothetical protein
MTGSMAAVAPPQVTPPCPPPARSASLMEPGRLVSLARATKVCVFVLFRCMAAVCTAPARLPQTDRTHKAAPHSAPAASLGPDLTLCCAAAAAAALVLGLSLRWNAFCLTALWQLARLLLRRCDNQWTRESLLGLLFWQALFCPACGPILLTSNLACWLCFLPCSATASALTVSVLSPVLLGFELCSLQREATPAAGAGATSRAAASTLSSVHPLILPQVTSVTPP